MNEYKYLINMLYRLFGVEVSSDISEDKLNWNIILYQATLHRVTSVLFWNLQKTKKASTINNNIYKMLKSQYEYNSYRDKYCIKTASELTKKFKQNSFKSDFVFLKGPILSIYLDPGFSYRVYSDLDVLMKKESLSNAKKTLSNLGYKQGKIDKNTDEFIEATRTEIIAHEFGSHETVEFYQIFDNSINNIIVDINYSLFWKKILKKIYFPQLILKVFLKIIYIILKMMNRLLVLLLNRSLFRPVYIYIQKQYYFVGNTVGIKIGVI
ncbi:nucleotidyltransferase family protein [Streptococcus mutans]|nr:nucleotidyltransferase family protein [Streptococcus mutans]